jgi:predicted regulator of Ras-like GTPase activity (Roadblock/LC7/MglB family)
LHHDLQRAPATGTVPPNPPGSVWYGARAMDAAQALADLTEISAQIEAAVVGDLAGAVAASTFADEARGGRVAEAARELLQAAEQEGRGGLVQLQAATHEGSVFVVRDDDRFIAAVTAPDPTVGLVFYDLKTTLRLAGEQPETPEKEGGRPPKATPKETPEAGDGEVA